MLFDRIDLRQVRRDVASAAAASLALKKVLRARWARPMGDEQRALARLQRRMTELFVLLARARGRFHVSAPPRALRDAGAVWDREAYHARIAERTALDYTLHDEPTEAAPALGAVMP
jgi:hypothetical protein